jgi:hypothetical protein
VLSKCASPALTGILVVIEIIERDGQELLARAAAR